MWSAMWGLCVMLLLTLQVAPPVTASHSLMVGFYEKICPQAKNIFKEALRKVVAADAGISTRLIRLHFHDCFVRQGCDASVLLEGDDSERMHPANLNSLRGFEVLDEAKAALESQCPNTVSCADVLAFAACDAVEFTGGICYEVPSGRRDRRVSIKSDANVLPNFNSDAQTLKDEFDKKGLSLEDMVALSGTHSLGISHFSSFSKRLYNFNDTHSQDPSMDAHLADYLKSLCPFPGTERNTVPLDVATSNLLDVQYYRNLKKGKGLLTSDQTLWDSSLTSDMESFTKKPNQWAKNYGEAMVRMGAIDVLIRNNGEIRIKCSIVNCN